MQKSKSAKFSLAIKIASILTCVSVMAVGFASWLILKPAETVGDQSGSFTVYNVGEAQFTYSDLTWTNSEIVFGRPAGDTFTGWLRPVDLENMKVQSLTATLTFTLDTGNDNVNLDDLEEKVYVTFAPNEASKTAFDAAVDATYITAAVAGTAGETAIDSVAYDSETGMVTVEIDTVEARTLAVTINFNFGWGEKFDNKNPYVYYNGLAGGAEANAATAKADLEALAAISTCGYKVTIGTTDPASN